MNGTGTAADPYVISSVEDLALLSGEGYQSYAGRSKYFVLGCDIDFNGASFTPIGNSTYTFNGKFNGNFHVISNMVITGDSGYLGLFERCIGNAVIEKIVFRNCTVTDTGTTGSVGMVVGRVHNADNIIIDSIETDGCSISTGGNYAGGITGVVTWNISSGMTIKNIYVHDGSVIGSKYVGGIGGTGGYYGNDKPVTISHCRVFREVVYSSTGSADVYVGGIVGSEGYSASAVTIDSCTVKSSVVRASGYSVGGIAGYSGTKTTTTISNSKVDNCYIRSNSHTVGGIVGYHTNTCFVNIVNCTITRSTIIGTSQEGGIVGTMGLLDTTDTYNIVNPTITNNCIYSSSNSYAGGVIGYLYQSS